MQIPHGYELILRCQVDTIIYLVHINLVNLLSIQEMSIRLY
jgi:hypothetical protein